MADSIAVQLNLNKIAKFMFTSNKIVEFMFVSNCNKLLMFASRQNRFASQSNYFVM